MTELPDDPWHVYAKMRLGTLFIGDSHERIVCHFRISCHETEDDLRALRNAEAIVAAHNDGDTEQCRDRVLAVLQWYDVIPETLDPHGWWGRAWRGLQHVLQRLHEPLRVPLSREVLLRNGAPRVCHRL